MLLYVAQGPSSRVVEMFLIESQIKIKKIVLNLVNGDNLQPDYLKKNPLGQVPCLTLGDEAVCESTAICEYLDKFNNKENSLYGQNEIEKAKVKMWQRRIDLYIWENIFFAYKSSIGLEIFKTRILTLPDAAEEFAKVAKDNLKIFHNQLKNHRWISGENFSICDISLFCILDFGLQNKQPFDPGLLELNVWYSTMMTRESIYKSKENLEMKNE